MKQSKNRVATKIYLLLSVVALAWSAMSCTAAKSLLDFANQVHQDVKTQIDSIAKDTVYYTATIEEWDTLRHNVTVYDTATFVINPPLDSIDYDTWTDITSTIKSKPTPGGGYAIQTTTKRPDTVFMEKVITKTVTKYVDELCPTCTPDQPANKGGWWVILAIIGSIISKFGFDITKKKSAK